MKYTADPRNLSTYPARHMAQVIQRMALLGTLLLATSSGWAALLKSAEVTAVVNDVKVVDPVNGERPAGVKDVVRGEIGVKTGLKSRAELLFQDKTLTRLGANTLFSFNQGTRELELERGTLLLQVPKKVGGAKIRTAAVTAAITGTTILLEYSPIKWEARHPRGVSEDVALMAPEQCLLELQHPKRRYSKPDLAELQRKGALAKKATGHVKVMVLEGTLRLYLNNRLGESTLITAGQMIILSPNALSIPPAVNFDIAQLAKTSLLVNNANWRGLTSAVDMAAVSREITLQEQLKGSGDLLLTNLVIPGGGTEVFTLAQINQSVQAQNASPQAQAGPFAAPQPVFNQPQFFQAPPNGPQNSPAPIYTPPAGRAPVASISPATSSPYPSAGPADHTHSTINSGEVSVGGYDSTEEFRGAVEFNISDVATGAGSMLSFTVSKLESDIYPESGPGSFTINVLGYIGDNAPNLSDYDLATLGLLGTFSTTGLTIGKTFTFDASAVLDAALAANAFSLGIRLQAASAPGFGNAVSFNGFSLYIPPTEFGPLATITTPDPYLIGSGTHFVTDPSVTTNGVTSHGKIYRNATLDGAYTDYAFGSTTTFEISNKIGVYYANDPDGDANFRFSNLVISGPPTFDTADGPKYVSLISVGSLTSAVPGGTLNLDDLDGLFLATTNSSATLGPELSFTSTRFKPLPPGRFNPPDVPLGLYLEVYARGPSSDLNFESTVNFTGNRRLDLEAERNVFVTGGVIASQVKVIAGGSFTLAATGQIHTTDLEVMRANNITIDGSVTADNVRFHPSEDVTVGASGRIVATRFEVFGGRDLIGSGGALVDAASVRLDLQNVIDVSQSGGSLFADTLAFDLTNLRSFLLSDSTVQISGDLTIANINLANHGVMNATGNLVTSALGIEALYVTGNITATSIYSFFVADNGTNILQAQTISASGGLDFRGYDRTGSDVALPTNGETLTLTANSVSFGTSIGASTFDGGDANINSTAAGGNGGVLNANSPGDISVDTTISASSGRNSASVNVGGAGGAVNLASTAGAISVSSRIEVSSNDAANKRVSRQGGNIRLETGKASGTGIHVTNSGQLLSLLNATAPGPGGTIQVTSAGADILVDGKIQADRGTIDVRNNGAAGQIFVNAGSQLSADIIKVGALGVNGQLTVQANSQLSAVNTLKLYGGSGAMGKVLFTGAGNVNLSGSQIHIRANTVQVDAATHVHNNGATSVHATNHNYDPVAGAGGGKFQNAVTAGPVTGAPSFD